MAKESKDVADRAVREQLLHLLRGGGAHLDFNQLIADFPLEAINREIDDVPYTAWQVLEHMRIAQWDILEFTRNPNHISPDFPDGYWPSREIVADSGRWWTTVQSFQTDLHEMEMIVEDPATDLFGPIAHGSGQTVLREALLIADHNAYHLGVLTLMKRILSKSPR